MAPETGTRGKSIWEGLLVNIASVGVNIRLAYGRTPLSLACGWGSRIGLKNIERRATSPRTSISSLGQGYKLHVSCVRGFKDGRFCAIAVLVCPRSR